MMITLCQPDCKMRKQYLMFCAFCSYLQVQPELNIKNIANVDNFVMKTFSHCCS